MRRKEKRKEEKRGEERRIQKRRKDLEKAGKERVAVRFQQDKREVKISGERIEVIRKRVSTYIQNVESIAKNAYFF